jgi:hypothetical protein
MKPSKLVTLNEMMVAKSKQPWACFETNGIGEKGLGIAMHWNKSFIDMLHHHQIQGTTEQETLQLFFLYMAGQIADSVAGGEDTVNPAEMPSLTAEANRFVR